MKHSLFRDAAPRAKSKGARTTNRIIVLRADGPSVSATLDSITAKSVGIPMVINGNSGKRFSRVTISKLRLDGVESPFIRLGPVDRFELRDALTTSDASMVEEQSPVTFIDGEIERVSPTEKARESWLALPFE